MKKLFLIATLLFFSILGVNAQNNTTKTINHTVAQGETLYRISVNYKVSIDDIKKLNTHIVGDNIKLGDVLKIPSKAGGVAAKKPEKKKVEVAVKMDKPPVVLPKTADKDPIVNVAEQKDKKTEVAVTPPKKEQMLVADKSKKNNIKKGTPGTHVVAQGETLFGIASKYGQKVAAIKAWNSLGDNVIKIGQMLIVDEVATIASAPPPKKDLKPLANKDGDAVIVGSDGEVPLPPPPPVTAFQKKYAAMSKKKSRYKLVKEQGMATWFDDGSRGSSRNMYALHKSAPIRSILKVSNPMNRRYAYVMVIERLPDTVENDNVLIKLTSSVKKQLKVLDRKSIMETSYYVKR